MGYRPAGGFGLRREGTCRIRRWAAEVSGKRLSAEFGNAFSERNLRYMRQFFLLFPMRNALRSELSWTHYRLLMRVENEKARAFYLDECVKANWSTRQLERQITRFFILVSRDQRGDQPDRIEA